MSLFLPVVPSYSYLTRAHIRTAITPSLPHSFTRLLTPSLPLLTHSLSSLTLSPPIFPSHSLPLTHSRTPYLPLSLSHPLSSPIFPFHSLQGRRLSSATSSHSEWGYRVPTHQLLLQQQQQHQQHPQPHRKKRSTAPSQTALSNRTAPSQLAQSNRTAPSQTQTAQSNQRGGCLRKLPRRSWGTPFCPVYSPTYTGTFDSRPYPFDWDIL